MSDVLNTKAVTAADAYPWPRTGQVQRTVPVCSQHDPELWFPTEKENYDEAVALCGTCPLAALCRTVAAQRGEQGVWGGVLFRDGTPVGMFPQPGRPPKVRDAVGRGNAAA